MAAVDLSEIFTPGADVLGTKVGATGVILAQTGDAVANQVAFVAAGKIAEISPPGELFDSPKSAVCQRFLSRVMRY